MAPRTPAPGAFRVTYDIVTPESAESGDVAESGFILPGAWRQSATEPGPVEMRLRDAVRLCSPQEDSGRWFSEVDGRTDYRTGAVELRHLNPPHNITPASYARLRRVLGFEESTR